MAELDDVRDNLKALRRNLLKYRTVGVLNRKLSILDGVRANINSAITQINGALSAAQIELTQSIIAALKKSGSPSSIGVKQAEFEYADALIERDGLDGQLHDIPEFPEFKLTPGELSALEQAVKEYGSYMERIGVLLVVDKSNADRVTAIKIAEDSYKAYFMADSVDSKGFERDINFASDFEVEQITFTRFIYEGLDDLFIGEEEIKLLSVDAYAVEYGFSGVIGSYNVVLDVYYNPTLRICKVSDVTATRKTTAQMIIDATNTFDFKVDISIRGRRFSIPANKRQLVIIGAELTGVPGLFIAVEKSA